jgi:hypothetical protein
MLGFGVKKRTTLWRGSYHSLNAMANRLYCGLENRKVGASVSFFLKIF